MTKPKSILIKSIKMKKLFSFLLLIGLVVSLTAQTSKKTMQVRFYPFKHKNTATELNKGLLGYDSSSYDFYTVDSTWFFSMSAGITLFTVTGDGDISAIEAPGIGYGARWKPTGYKGNYLLGADLFLSANYSEDEGYASVVITPVIWFLDWFGLSYGTELQIQSAKVKSVPRFGIVVGWTF